MPEMGELKIDGALQSETSLLGYFAPAGTEDLDPGVLRWTDSGGELKLFGEVSWPGEVGAPTGPVHGQIDADDLTLLEAWKARRGIGTSHALTIRAGTLLRGGHFDSESEWSRVVLRTANLHEWIPETGITSDYSLSDDGRMQTFQLEWSPPQKWPVELNEARLTLSPCMATEFDHSPGHSLRTDYEVMVEVPKPVGLETLHRHFAQPLLCLTVLAADLPDALTLERVSADEPRRAARVFRQGARVASREWNPSQPFLFYASDLPDLSRAFKRWFDLFERVPEALGNFAASVNEGNVYSPDRLLKVAAAAEAYHREIHHRRGRLEQRLEQLRDFAGLPAEGPFCKRNLCLIAAGRHYHGHSGTSSYGFSAEEIVDSGFSSIRRVTALMQGCLMRELGFDATEIQERFNEHYANWPIP
jgi:hypothetical protein